MAFNALHKFRRALGMHIYDSNFVNLHISHRARRCQTIPNCDLRRNLFVDIARFRCISNECIKSSCMYLDTTTDCSQFFSSFNSILISPSKCIKSMLPNGIALKMIAMGMRKMDEKWVHVFLYSFDIAHNNPDDTPHIDFFSGLNCIIDSNVISSSHQFVEHTCVWQSNIDIRHLTPHQRQVFPIFVKWNMWCYDNRSDLTVWRQNSWKMNEKREKNRHVDIECECL